MKRAIEPRQPHQEHVARARVKEQEGHHRTHVIELDPIRRVQAHRALDRIASDLQNAHAVLLDDFDRLARAEPVARTLHDFARRPGITA